MIINSLRRPSRQLSSLLTHHLRLSGNDHKGTIGRVNSTSMSFLPPFKYMKGDELASLIKSGAKPNTDYVVIDVRDDDRIGGHILGSVHSPSQTFEDQVQELVKKTKDVPQVVFHCALSQQRGPKAARIYSELRSELQEKEGKEKDFDVFVLRGGFTEFQLRHRNDKTLVESWDKEVWNNQYF